MSDPVISPTAKRNYGSKLTLDLDKSYPSGQPEDCDDLSNVIRVNGRSFGSRPGAQMVGCAEVQTSGFDAWCGLHRYDIDGSLYLLSVGSGGAGAALWKEREGTISVNYTGAGSNPEVDIRAAESGGHSCWQVTLKLSGAAISGWPKYYGDGIEKVNFARWSINHLTADIDAEADWSATSSMILSDTRAAISQIGGLLDERLVLSSSPDLTIRFRTTSAAVECASAGTSPDVLDWSNIVGVNAVNCFYLPMGSSEAIAKWDSSRLLKPGLPRATISSIADAGSGATHAIGNQYTYRVGFSRVDAKDNQIYGPYSDDSLAVASHTVGGVATDININFFPMCRAETEAELYQPRSAYVNGAQVGVSTVTVLAGHLFRAGDRVILLNRATSTYEEKTLTAVAATTVTFAGIVNVNNNDVISNIRVQIQRTDNGGIDFFEVATIPNDALLSSGVAQTFLDSVSDTNLGDSIEDQIKLPEPPPDAKFACIHQGLLVLANLSNDSMGFAWNDPEWGLEAFPSATNRDRVTGLRGGDISAVISESDTALAIFKGDAYFRIEGDLASGQYVINEVTSSGIGIASHSSLIKTEHGLFGISDRGPVLIRDGKISLEFGTGVQSLFKENSYVQVADTAITSAQASKLVPKRSTGVYWSQQDLILFFIPAESGTPQSAGAGTSLKRYCNSNSQWLCYDLQKQEWRNWGFHDPEINAHLGMIEHDGEIFFISSNNYSGVAYSGRSSNYVWKLRRGDEISHFADNVDAIGFGITLAFETLGAPDSEKKMDSIKVMSVNVNDYMGEFTLNINEYRNLDITTAYTSATRTFDGTDSSLERIIDPVPGDFLSNSVEFSNVVRYERPVISGFALSYKVTTSGEFKDKKGG